MSKKHVFSLNPNPTFTLPVKIPVPGSKAAAIDVTYKHLTRTEVDEYLERNKERDDTESALEIVVGWGLSEEFNEENLARLFENYGGAGRAVIQTYLREIWGGSRGKLKAIAQALYDSGPTEEQAAQLATFGLTLDDFEEKVIEVWPENRLPMLVFQAMGTQWRMGFNGPIGLDYNVLPTVMKQVSVPKKERKRVFNDVTVMERAALRVMRE